MDWEGGGRVKSTRGTFLKKAPFTFPKYYQVLRIPSAGLPPLMEPEDPLSSWMPVDHRNGDALLFFVS